MKPKYFKKNISGKKNVTKNALFFLLRATNNPSFTSNSKFFCKLKHMAHLSKTVCGTFHLRFCLVFVKFYIFVQQKA